MWGARECIISISLLTKIEVQGTCVCVCNFKTYLIQNPAPPLHSGPLSLQVFLRQDICNPIMHLAARSISRVTRDESQLEVVLEEKLIRFLAAVTRSSLYICLISKYGFPNKVSVKSTLSVLPTPHSVWPKSLQQPYSQPESIYLMF